MGQEYRDYSKSPTMSDARAGGLFHPNCGHNVNIFIPGITEERDLSWKQDFTEQYELRQQENNAKRQVKQWERRAEVAKANGDQMAYKAAKSKANEWKQKRKDIAQKRNELDKKQREERFSRPRGKAFPKDSSSLKSQKNENKGYTQEQAKATAEVKKKVEEANQPKSFEKGSFLNNGKYVTGWKTDNAFNALQDWHNAVDSGEYKFNHSLSWWDKVAKQHLAEVTPQSVRDFVEADEGVKQAIHKYSTNAYKTINGVLRGIKKGNSDVQVADEVVSQLDKFFSTEGKLQKDTVLYRGMNLKGLFGNDDNAIQAFRKNPEAFVGMTWTDPGYTSTSPNYTKLHNYMGAAKGNNVVLHIYAEAGTKGAYIEDWSAYSYEKECLLDRGTTFRIVDTQVDKEGRIHAMVEILK